MNLKFLFQICSRRSSESEIFVSQRQRANFRRRFCATQTENERKSPSNGTQNLFERPPFHNFMPTKFEFERQNFR